MKELLRFLEKELNTQFQFVLLEQEEKLKDIGVLKTCYSKVHNTRHVAVRLFYKKTF